MTNPITDPWPGPHGGVPPWDQMSPALFPDAFETAIAEQRQEIETVAANPEKPAFENTIAAMERSGRMLDRVERMFGVARENVTNREYQALEREWQPRLAAAADAILFNERLFGRIEAVYESLTASNLAPDQIRLASRVYEHFVRRGAKLKPAEKARLSDINQQLAAHFAEFRAKVLADENTWTVIERESDLAGLPASVAAAAKTAADERGLSGWAIVNTRSSVDPFLTFSTVRRPSRTDLEEVQEPRRQRRRQRHQGDHWAHRQSACGASQAARLREPRTLAHAGYDGG